MMEKQLRVFDSFGTQIHEGNLVEASGKTWKVLDFVSILDVQGKVVDIVANVENTRYSSDCTEYTMVQNHHGSWIWPRSKRVG